MSVVASEFQAVMDVVRVWWQESFEALKVHGQHALREQKRADETLAYVSVYCSKRAVAYASRHASTEFQQRGVAHMHITMGGQQGAAAVVPRFKDSAVYQSL